MALSPASRWTLAALLLAAVGAAAWLVTAKKPPEPKPREAPSKGTGEAVRLTTEPLPADAPRLKFADAAERLRLPPQFRGMRSHQFPEDMGGGVAVADFDGDGRPDVLIVGSGTMPEGGPSYLFRNETPSPGAPVVLTDATAGSGLPGPLVGMGAAVADVDDDGRPDVVLTYYGGVKLLHNEGGMRFRDVTKESGLAVADRWCTGACFGDADGDGDLDLYVCRYVDLVAKTGREETERTKKGMPRDLDPTSYRAVPNLFFRNRGDGTFEGGEALAAEMGFSDPNGRGMAAAFGDFDQDGLPDLYVANDASENAMFHGIRRPDGSRAFEDARYASGTADPRGSMGLAIADADGDGDDEILVTNWFEQGAQYSRNLARGGRPGRLLFMDAGDRSGIGIVTRAYVGWATDFVDFDLDGRPDVYVADGSTFLDKKDERRLVAEPSLVFWNAGDTRGFLDAGAAWGDVWTVPRSLRGGASADLDGDGDADLVLGALEGPPEVLVLEGPPRGRPLWVELRQKAPNVFGVGARVTVACGGRELSREMRSAPTYLSGGPLELLFGLGDAKGDATVRVRWPDGTSSEAVFPADRTRVTARKP